MDNRKKNIQVLFDIIQIFFKKPSKYTFTVKYFSVDRKINFYYRNYFINEIIIIQPY